jgi:hypothetical protein
MFDKINYLCAIFDEQDLFVLKDWLIAKKALTEVEAFL